MKKKFKLRCDSISLANSKDEITFYTENTSNTFDFTVESQLIFLKKVCLAPLTTEIIDTAKFRSDRTLLSKAP